MRELREIKERYRGTNETISKNTGSPANELDSSFDVCWHYL
jgi:hypothetical protein